ncbi:MAG: hypothetical protein H7Y18_12480 [Clostridiaceae bacterium]|nr:hypothetical protein [Clostridiaceae bacterium]
MLQTILPFLFFVALVVGFVYFFYLIKEKGENIDENYFGITYSILDTLLGKELTYENVKNILRIVSECVYYVESNMKELEDQKKENIALSMIVESTKKLDLRYPLSDNSIRYLIRLSCGFMIKQN